MAPLSTKEIGRWVNILETVPLTMTYGNVEASILNIMGKDTLASREMAMLCISKSNIVNVDTSQNTVIEVKIYSSDTSSTKTSIDNYIKLD